MNHSTVLLQYGICGYNYYYYYSLFILHFEDTRMTCLINYDIIIYDSNTQYLCNIWGFVQYPCNKVE